MEHTDIQSKVVGIIANILKVNKEAITNDATLESLGADSLNRVQFVMDLEEAFNVEIDDNEAEKLTTVKEAADYIHKLLQP